MLYSIYRDDGAMEEWPIAEGMKDKVGALQRLEFESKKPYPVTSVLRLLAFDGHRCKVVSAIETEPMR